MEGCQDEEEGRLRFSDLHIHGIWVLLMKCKSIGTSDPQLQSFVITFTLK